MGLRLMSLVVAVNAVDQDDAVAWAQGMGGDLDFSRLMPSFISRNDQDAFFEEQQADIRAMQQRPATALGCYEMTLVRVGICADDSGREVDAEYVVETLAFGAVRDDVACTAAAHAPLAARKTQDTLNQVLADETTPARRSPRL